jgi:hypothetical protein
MSNGINEERMATLERGAEVADARLTAVELRLITMSQIVTSHGKRLHRLDAGNDNDKKTGG